MVETILELMDMYFEPETLISAIISSVSLKIFLDLQVYFSQTLSAEVKLIKKILH
jgi:hypothetical protein